MYRIPILSYSRIVELCGGGNFLKASSIMKIFLHIPIIFVIRFYNGENIEFCSQQCCNLWLLPPFQFFSWNQIIVKTCVKKVNFTEITEIMYKIFAKILSHIFDKNFVKSTFLLKKLLKSWFHEIFLVRENFSFFHTAIINRLLLYY